MDDYSHFADLAFTHLPCADNSEREIKAMLRVLSWRCTSIQHENCVFMEEDEPEGEYPRCMKAVLPTEEEAKKLYEWIEDDTLGIGTDIDISKAWYQELWNRPPDNQAVPIHDTLKDLLQRQYNG